jgi:aldose 1-epimerase
MAGDIVLTDGHLAVTIRPAFGASIARFDYVGGGSVVPLFRPEPAEGGRDAFELACQVLVPWSNRISSSGFTFRGKRYDLEPNIASEPFPIHGNGFRCRGMSSRQMFTLPRCASTPKARGLIGTRRH